MALVKPFADYSGTLKEIQSGDQIDTSLYSTSGITFTTIEQNLGVMMMSGSFTITVVGATSGRPVLIQQAVGPYTGKGTLADEAEMDQVIATAATTSTTTIQVYWNSINFPVTGNFKFNYVIL